MRLRCLAHDNDKACLGLDCVGCAHAHCCCCCWVLLRPQQLWKQKINEKDAGRRKRQQEKRTIGIKIKVVIIVVVIIILAFIAPTISCHSFFNLPIANTTAHILIEVALLAPKLEDAPDFFPRSQLSQVGSRVNARHINLTRVKAVPKHFSLLAAPTERSSITVSLLAVPHGELTNQSNKQRPIASLVDVQKV